MASRTIMVLPRLLVLIMFMTLVMIIGHVVAFVHLQVGVPSSAAASKVDTATSTSACIYPSCISSSRLTLRSGESVVMLMNQKKLMDGVIDVGEPLGQEAAARDFYDSWNRGDLTRAISYFAEDVYFEDTNVKEPFRGKAAVLQYFEECTDALPGWQFMIDEVANDDERRTLGVKWHVGDRNGDPLPIPSRGLSFLKFNEEGLICECQDIPEPPVKSGRLQLPFLKIFSKVLGL